jgi:peptidoglycan hydrolase CwlO-like protein|tara:strand:+ start:331 stop:633 length:303 start_codon:yes stop_codon:yes gene_type:complete
MATKIGEGTNVTLDLKTIAMIVGFTVSLATMYFTLKADIAHAAQLPEPEITKIEFSYKDQIIRATIEKVESDMSSIKEDVSEIKSQLDKMDARLYEISKK